MPIYSEIWAGPARNYRRTSSGVPVTSAKKYITIHNTSNDASAEGEASYAKVRTDGTSSHYYCDHDSLLQSLNTDWCANHVGSTEGNVYGISYEITGFNGWSRQTWLDNVAWEKLAAQIAVDCREFDIPVRLLTIDEMRAKTYKGVITHDMARIAWGGTTHTDPGPGFPMDHLLAQVTSHLNGVDMAIDQTTFDGLAWRGDAWITNSPTVRGGPTKGERNEMHYALKALEEKVGALSSPKLTDEQLATIAEQAAALVGGKLDALFASMPKPPTVQEIADLLAQRLAQ